MGILRPYRSGDFAVLPLLVKDLNLIELREDFTADRRGRPVRFLGRTLYLAANLPEETAG